jgi:tRNA (guanine37-N1)-methyltransferase
MCLGSGIACCNRRAKECYRLFEFALGERPQAICVVTQNREPMRIDIVTLFPSFFEPIVNGSILGRAQTKDLVRIHIHDLWNYVRTGERADDAPYGGGPGMVMRLEPLITCMESLLGPDLRVPEACSIIVPSPSGVPFDHASAERLSGCERLIIVCGHYEGIDERFYDLVRSTEISLGDFVLTGGEIPALAFLDATVRLVPGVINPESLHEESFHEGVLDWPHYTRPAVFRNLGVPNVLLSGDHKRIDAWRRAIAGERTRARRPDIG